MSYRGNPGIDFTSDLTSVKKLRESVEGGPGSGPQGGKKDKGKI